MDRSFGRDEQEQRLLFRQTGHIQESRGRDSSHFQTLFWKAIGS